MHIRPTRQLAILGLLAVGACADEHPLPLEQDSLRPGFALISGNAIAVNSLADPGAGGCTTAGDGDGCTLREAIAAVDGGGTITFDVTGTIELGGTELLITKPITIAGPGADQLVIDARGLSRVLLAAGPVPVNLSGMTLRNGNTGGPGGCIQNEGTTLSLTLVEVRGCTSWGAGGGIGHSGGAGWGYLTLDRVTVRDSWAANGGGGIYVNHNAQMAMEESTVNNNEGREGGGIGATGYATIRNSTISGNRARFHGGGVYAADRGMPGVQVEFSTIALNTSDADANGDGDGGGIFNSNGTLLVRGTIIARNVDRTGQAPDCAATVPLGPGPFFNLIQDPTGCGAYLPTAVVVGVDPLLGPLADNGGPTLTHLPLAGSPAIDAAGAICPPPAVDQRGAARPQGSACDIGAVEVGPTTVDIDVRPDSDLNPVNLRSTGALPVAILSSETFDAADVDIATIELEGVGVATRANGTYMATLEDVNGDGLLDLVVHFRISALGLDMATTSVTLTADLVGGGQIQGSDAVTIVP